MKISPDHEGLLNATVNNSNLDSGTPVQLQGKDKLEFSDILQKITQSFAKSRPNSLTTEHAIHDFTVIGLSLVFGISYDGTLTVIDLKSKEVRSIIKVSEHLMAITKNTEETCVFLQGYNKELIVVEVPSGKVIEKMKSPESVKCLAYSTIGLIVTANNSGKCSTFEWDGISLTKGIQRSSFGIQEPDKLLLSEDGNLVIAYKENKVIIFDKDKKKTYELPNEVPDALIAISPDCNELALSWELIDKNIQNQIAIVRADNPYEVTNWIQLSAQDSAEISQISISTGNDYIVGALKNGHIKIWKLSEQKQSLTIPVHSNQIDCVRVLGNVVLTASRDKTLCATTIPIFKENTCKHYESVTKLVGNEKFLFIHEDKFNMSDLINREELRAYPCSNISRIKMARNSHNSIVVYLGVVIARQDQIIKWNPETDDRESVISSCPGRLTCIELSSDENSLFVGIETPSQNRDAISEQGRHPETDKPTIYIYSTKDWSIVYKLKGHEGTLSDLLYIKDHKVLVSASTDQIVRVWEENNKYAGKTLVGHTGSITKLSYCNSMIITASKDNRIGLWSVLDCTNILFLSGHENSVTTIYPSLDVQYLYSMDVNGNLKLWSLKSLDCVYTEFYADSDSFFLSSDEENIILKSFDKIQIVENPMKSDEIQVVGIPEKHKFIKYFSSLVNDDSPPLYDAELDRGVITPYLITPMHVYAFMNMPRHLQQSLENKSPILYTSKGLNPLSLSVNRAFKECMTTIIRSLKRSSQPYAFACVNTEILIGLNAFNFPAVSKLYSMIFQKSMNATLPTFISGNVSTPIYKKSERIRIEQKDFELKKSNEGKSVVYYESLVKMNLASGSSTSIAFLRSLIKTRNDEIFKSEFIETFLEYKWKRLKYAMYVQAVIYFIFLASFLAVVFENEDNRSGLLVLPFILNLFFMTYEIFQIATAFRIYWESVWNYVDLGISIMTIFFAIEVWGDLPLSESNTVLLILSSLSLVRGISYFRLFKKTRYMVNLLLQIIKDMFSFVLLLIYTTLSFGVLIFIAFDVPRENFQEYLGFSFILNLGEFDNPDYTQQQWVIFIFAAAVNPIIMLNLLIAIMGDTYDRVQDSVEVADNKELAGMILEVEALIFHHRKSDHEKYLQVCTEDKQAKLKHEWHGKITAVKNLIKSEGLVLRDINKKLDRLFSSSQINLKEENELLLENIKKLVHNQESSN